MDIANLAQGLAGRFSPSDGLVLLLALVALWGIRKAPKGAFFDDPLNRKQGLALRGIFACVVVFCHVSGQVLSEDGFLFPRLEFWGSLSVSIFFGLSGYGLMFQRFAKKDYMNNFWCKRVKTLLHPYLIVSILTFIQWIRGDFDFFMRVKGKLGLIRGGWFVVVLFLFYGVFWWANRRDLYSKGENLILTIAGVVLVSVIGAFYNTGIHFFYSNGAFIVGLALGAYRKSGCMLLQSHWWQVAGLTCIIALMRCTYALNQWSMEGLRADSCYFLHMFWFLGITALSMKWQLGNRVLAWLGTISYELYLVHEWVIEELCHWRPEWSTSSYAWTVVATSLLLAWALHAGVDAWKRRGQVTLQT